MADEVERPNLQMTDKIRKSVTRTVELIKRRKDLNDEIKNEREQMEKIGVHPRAYQDEVRNFRLYDEAERVEYMASRKVMSDVLKGAESDIFAEEMAERAEKLAKKKAKLTGKEGAPDPDTNPKSKPKATSAKKPAVTNPPIQDGDVSNETGDELIARVAREKLAEQEQREGDALLATAGKGEPMSQSAQVAAINAKLGLDKA